MISPSSGRHRVRHSFPTRRSSDLREMIHGVPALIEFISQNTTLLPGTLIFTGTPQGVGMADRKSTRLNSSHPSTSYAVFCLKKKTPAFGSSLHRASPRIRYLKSLT